MTRIACSVIILCLLLPFVVFAMELPQTPSVSPLNNAFGSLRGASAKIESYILPESAKEKGLWAWSREVLTDLFLRAKRAIDTGSRYAKEKGQTFYDSVKNKLREKIKRDAWTTGELYINN